MKISRSLGVMMLLVSALSVASFAMEMEDGGEDLCDYCVEKIPGMIDCSGFKVPCPPKPKPKPEPVGVCWMTPEGNLICEKVLE